MNNNQTNYCEIIFDKTYIDKELPEYFIIKSPYGMEKSAVAIKKNFCKVLSNDTIKIRAQKDWKFQFKSNKGVIEKSAIELQNLISENNTYLNQEYSVLSNTDNYSVIEGETDGSLFVVNNKNLIDTGNESYKLGNKTENKPLVVNLYAGPSAGKTTAAYDLTSALKKKGCNVEYVSEFAKELVLEDRLEELKNQEFVTDEQFHRLDRLRNSVDIIVTDSPVLLGKVYGEKNISKEYSNTISNYYNSFNNYDLFVVRGEGFQKEGRIQNLEESKELDAKIIDMLNDNYVCFDKYYRDDIENTTENILAFYNTQKQKQNNIVKIDDFGNSLKNTVIKMDTLIEAEHVCDIIENEISLLSKSDQNIYMSYIASERERLYLKNSQEDWYDYLKPYKDWTDLEKAEQKIKAYTNKKAYENSLPYVLRTRKQFVLWKWKINDAKDKAIKIPINPWNGQCASSTDQSTWATFDKCIEMYNKHGKRNKCAGIGIMLGHGLVGIDFDKCIDANDVLDKQKEWLMRRINSYTELSPSGDGLHILAFGNLPKEYMKRNDALGIECYDEGRFFTLTGEIYDNQHKMSAANVTESAILELLNLYMQKPPQINTANETLSVPKEGTQFADDNELIACIRKSKKGEVFADLFDKGEVPKKEDGLYNTNLMRPKGASEPKITLTSNEEILKYYEMDNSRCDTALCGLIAGYTDDPMQIDRIFRQSALMRAKWDSMRGDKTYGSNLCEHVLKSRQFRYNKNNGKKKTLVGENTQKKTKNLKQCFSQG